MGVFPGDIKKGSETYVFLLKFTLYEAVLTSAHNLCLGAKTRKIGIPLHTPVLLYESGV